MFRWLLTMCIHLLVLRSAWKALALSYVVLCRSMDMASWFLRRQRLPTVATLSLLCVDGWTAPVILMTLGLQKHNLGIVQPDPGLVGPLLKETVRLLVLNLMILHLSGPSIWQVKTRLLLILARLCSWSLSFGLRKTPLFSIRVVELLLRKPLFSRNVRVRFLGWGRTIQLKCMLRLSLLLSRWAKVGRLLGAATTRTLCSLVPTRAETGQRTTGPLQIGSSRPSIVRAIGYSCDLAFFVRMTFPTGVSSVRGVLAVLRKLLKGVYEDFGNWRGRAYWSESRLLIAG